jgi:RecB family exonuclease
VNGHVSDPLLDFARHQFEVEARRESDAPADAYDGVIGRPVRRTSWSASSLARIGSCPFKWFASDVLALREPDEADTELPPNLRGTLLHKTLEIAARSALEAGDVRTAMLEALEASFAEAEALAEPLAVVANWRLRRTEQLQKLERAIVSDEFIDEGAVVVGTELTFRAEFCGLRLKGTIDRVDRLPDGRLLAVDYKHGGYVTRIKDESGYLKVEIQLPIYSAIALPQLFPEEVGAGGRFFHIADAKVTRGREADLETILSRIKKLLEQGRFAVDPDIKLQACDFCEFDVVCRVGPRVALKH